MSKFLMNIKPLLLVTAISLSLSACKKESETPIAETSNKSTSSALTMETQVDIVAWPGYIERGESDKAYDWVTEFEKATACKVNVKTAGTSDEMVSLMNQGGYDLVTASGDASLRLVQNALWHTVGDKHYGVPYQWGPNVLMYRTDIFKTPPTSWSVVFEEQNLPDGKSNKGRVQAYDGAIYIADAANYLKTKQPALGITDPYALNEKQYAAALDLLRKQKPMIHRYWHDATVQMTDFKKEGVVASGSWPYQVNALLAEKPAQPIASTIPIEGATGWADTTMLATDAKHPNCAYAWMEWSISPKVQADVAAWFGSVPANPKACNGNALLGEEGCKTNGIENFDKIHFWRTPESKCANGECVPYSRWAEDYIAIMSGN
jgi:putative spermidine/putrescine transport system substrate-binding protein